jgi:hypothetical protein
LPNVTLLGTRIGSMFGWPKIASQTIATQSRQRNPSAGGSSVLRITRRRQLKKSNPHSSHRSPINDEASHQKAPPTQATTPQGKAQENEHAGSEPTGTNRNQEKQLEAST